MGNEDLFRLIQELSGPMPSPTPKEEDLPPAPFFEPNTFPGMAYDSLAGLYDALASAMPSGKSASGVVPGSAAASFFGYEDEPEEPMASMGGGALIGQQLGGMDSEASAENSSFEQALIDAVARGDNSFSMKGNSFSSAKTNKGEQKQKGSFSTIGSDPVVDALVQSKAFDHAQAVTASRIMRAGEQDRVDKAIANKRLLSGQGQLSPKDLDANVLAMLTEGLKGEELQGFLNVLRNLFMRQAESSLK